MSKQYRMSHTLEEMKAINHLIQEETDRITDAAFDHVTEENTSNAVWWRDLRRRWSMRTRNAQEAEQE